MKSAVQLNFVANLEKSLHNFARIADTLQDLHVRASQFQRAVLMEFMKKTCIWRHSINLTFSNGLCHLPPSTIKTFELSVALQTR